jgi:hypothetical protein
MQSNRRITGQSNTLENKIVKADNEIREEERGC